MRSLVLACLLLLVGLVFSTDLVDDYLLIPSEVRNYMFVGKGRSGKTTTIEVLKNVHYVAKFVGFARGTVDPELSTFTIHREGKYYNINILDTPGLFERGETKNETRDNEVIMDLINKCVELEITKLHGVYFVLNPSGNWDPRDEESLLMFYKLFEGMTDRIKIIITHAQDYKDKKKLLIEQILKIDGFGEFKDRILFSGAIPEDRQDEIGVHTLERISSMRVELLNDMFTEKNAFSVKELNMYKERTAFLSRLFEALQEGRSVSSEIVFEFKRLFKIVTGSETGLPPKNDL